MKTRKPVAVVVVAALVVTGCTTTVRRHPSFGERRAKIASVAVVPADVAFVRMVFRGDNQPLPEETGRVRGRLHKTPLMLKSKAEKFETTLGSDITQLAENAQVDGLVFAKMNGFKKSGGEIARDWAFALLLSAATLGTVFVAPAPSSGATLQLALVDGTSGDVLWANTAGKAGDFEEKGLDGLVNQLFNGFPK